MLILRIRRAESALSDGRLDEAFEIARSDDVRAHARGQKLIGRLVRSLIDRGRQLLDEERPQQALADCEKAALLAGNLPEVCALRTGIAAALGGHQEHARRHEHAVNLGREQAARGQLSVAAEVLADAAVDHAPARSLLAEVEARRVTAQAALERARGALSRQDWPLAIESALEARGQHASSQPLSELTEQIKQAVLVQITSAFEAGRLDLAAVLLERLRPLAADALAVEEWTGILENCRLARASVAAGDLRRAAELLGRLKTVQTAAAWIGPALEQAEQGAAAIEALQSGPLGWLAGTPVRVDDGKTVLLRNDPPARAPGAPEPAGVSPMSPGSRLPSRLLLHVDAVGSFLAVRDAVVRIGPAGRGRGATGTPGCEVTLAADPALPWITIERVDDDYFLSCDKPVQVNNVPTKRKLLTGGDQIALSPRCRLKFEVPHPASTSAVLSVSGTRLPGCDARRIVLMDRAMVMGPGQQAHIRADALGEAAVLVVHDERLMCRTGEAVTVEDRPMDRVHGLPVGARIRVGAVQFVVKEHKEPRA